MLVMGIVPPYGPVMIESSTSTVTMGGRTLFTSEYGVGYMISWWYSIMECCLHQKSVLCMLRIPYYRDTVFPLTLDQGSLCDGDGVILGLLS